MASSLSGINGCPFNSVDESNENVIKLNDFAADCISQLIVD